LQLVLRMAKQDSPDLRRVPFFAGLPANARKTLQRRMKHQRVVAGTVLVHPGERGDFLALLTDGEVELSAGAGKTQTIRPLGGFGEGMLRYGVPSSYTARAVQPSTLWFVYRKDWLAVGGKNVGAQTGATQSAAPTATHQINRRTHRLRTFLLFSLVILALAAVFLGPPGVAALNRNLASTALDAGRPDLAESYLRFALQWQPNSAEINDALGFALYAQGRLPEAQTYFQQAIQQDENLASAQNNLGVTLLALGQPASGFCQPVPATCDRFGSGECLGLRELGQRLFSKRPVGRGAARLPARFRVGPQPGGGEDALGDSGYRNGPAG
jgi:hypothetical protein